MLFFALTFFETFLPVNSKNFFMFVFAYLGDNGDIKYFNTTFEEYKVIDSN